MKKHVLTILSFVIAISCSEQGDSVTPIGTSTWSEQNIRNFADVDEMFHFANGVSVADDHFLSYEEIYRDVLGKLENVQNEDEHEKLLKEYADIVYLEDETYYPILSNSFYRKVIGRERIYSSGGFLHKVIDDEHIIVTEQNNLEQLRGLISIDNLSDDFKVMTYQERTFAFSDGRVEANCGQELKKDYHYNPSGCQDDRRAWIRAYSYYVISGSNYTPTMISEGWGTRRTGVFCNWKEYETEIWTRNASYTVTVTINGTSVGYNLAFPDYNAANGDEWSHVIYNGSVTGPIYWTGGAVPSIQFTKVHAECATRGSHGGWAIINCQ